MDTSRRILRILAFLSISSTPALATAETADYWKCTGRVGGEWNYGRAPSVCDASAFGSDTVLKRDFPRLIFSDVAGRSAERDRYVGEMNALIRESAAYYLKSKKPSVTKAELDAWTLGIMATAANESYWSQYRVGTNGKYKMMRGDYGHGHGMMQIDDRAHFDVVSSGVAWNLATNLTYAMDLFYVAWTRAPSQSCVGSATNYVARTRAAWSAYNGGSSQICRFTNTKSAWAQNDRNFYASLTERTWSGYVVNAAQAASVDVACLMENKENCPAPGAAAPPKLLEGVLYALADGRSCVIANGRASCVAEARDRLCLGAVKAYASDQATTVTPAQLASYQPQTLERHALCRRYDATLFAVGANAQLATAINLRATPGGGVLGYVPAREVVTIVDFELRGKTTRDRYYRVKYGKLDGWIFGGLATTHADWAVATDQPVVTQASVARIGQTVEVVNAYGINLRATPGGDLLLNVPRGAVVTVTDREVRDATNDVYYRVVYAGRTGYLFSGSLLPSETVANWTRVK